jgi:hypothetical protein
MELMLKLRPKWVNRVDLAASPRLRLYPDEQTSLPSDGIISKVPKD